MKLDLSLFDTMNIQTHWEDIYQTKEPTQVSWYQPHSELSLKLIKSAGGFPNAQIIDVGGGASTLVDDLLDNGYRNLTVLDISANALDKIKTRLGNKAETVN